MFKMFKKSKKDIIFSGLMAFIIVVTTVFIMSLFSAGSKIEVKYAEGPANSRSMFIGAVIALAIGFFVGLFTGFLQGESLSKILLRLECTKWSELLGTGFAMAGVLTFGSALGVLASKTFLENVDITNAFWLWIGLLPLLLALVKARKLITNRISFAISYIIIFVVSVSILSKLFNPLIKFLIAASG